MAQNINNVLYVHMANPGVGQVPPPGQAYQLLLNSLVWLISTRGSNPEGRSTTLYKTNMGFRLSIKNPVNKAWRDLAKDLMIERNYVPGARAGIYPDADFQAIVAGMRRLSPACNELATASAANNLARIEDIDEAVVHLVKDCVTKLFNTINTQGPTTAQGHPGVPFAQVIVSGNFTIDKYPSSMGPCHGFAECSPSSAKRSPRQRSSCSTWEQPSASTTSSSSSSSSTWEQPSARTTSSSSSSSA